jgi:hypothetical protein
LIAVYLSGTGEYTLSFTLPDDFSANDGAFIAYSYGVNIVGGTKIIVR